MDTQTLITIGEIAGWIAAVIFVIFLWKRRGSWITVALAILTSLIFGTVMSLKEDDWGNLIFAAAFSIPYSIFLIRILPRVFQRRNEARRKKEEEGR